MRPRIDLLRLFLFTELLTGIFEACQQVNECGNASSGKSHLR